MPVKKCSNGKWRIGSGPCMYTSKEKADKAYQAYRARVSEATTCGSIAARYYKRKKRKVRKSRSPTQFLRYTVNASREELDAFVEQAIELALERALEGANDEK